MVITNMDAVTFKLSILVEIVSKNVLTCTRAGNQPDKKAEI